MLQPTRAEPFVLVKSDLAAWGKRLAAARQAAGYSQRAAAKALGCGQRIIVQWELGRFAPMGDRLRAIATLYGMPLADVVP